MASYDILAQGHIDKTLTGNPTTTFWKSVHARHTKFACESVSQPFNTAVAFGQESQILVNRVGDMIYQTYLRIELPGIVACDTKTDTSCAGIASGSQFPVYSEDAASCNPAKGADEAALLEFLPADYNDMSADQQTAAIAAAKNQWLREKYGAGTDLGCCSETEADCPDAMCPELAGTWTHWTNDIGQFILEKSKLIIGGQQIDQLWGFFLFVWEELTGKFGRRLGALVGRRYTRSQLVCDSRQRRVLYAPLPFWFTLNTGSALPLASLAYHGVSMTVEFAQLQKLIVVSKPDVAVRNAATGLALSPNDIKVNLEIGYVFLDGPEREKFASSHFETLFVQTQHYFQADNKALTRVSLPFNHPCSEIIFCVRRAVQEKHNNWCNLSGVDGRDPIETADLLLNTTSRFGVKDAVYLRGVVPYNVHTCIPESYIYCMSFALTPEDSTTPSGTCNLSRIDNAELSIKMQSALANENYTVYVWARTFNIMRFREGVAGAAYQ